MIDVSYFKTVEKSRYILTFGIVTNKLRSTKNHLKIKIDEVSKL